MKHNARVLQVAAFGLLYNMGQCCAAGTKLYVHETIYQDFMATYAQALKVW
jgi:acyl-CoA reductase-like NAD-dependent aldehyde dehydrogenase